MKIAIIGAGAMGSIYGGHLSLNNDVYLIDTNETIINYINENGLTLDEDGKSNIYKPKAVTNSKEMPAMDLVILFVKSLYSRAALEGNKNIIGKDTYLMTLQNGSGHEDILEEFVDKSYIIIGTTEDNGAVLGAGHIRRGGVGNTNIGMLIDDNAGFLNQVKSAFDCCGFNVKIHNNIQQLIWNKLFTNVSLSAVTGILQVKIGYIRSNEYAWNMTRALIHEAVEVANKLGLDADEEKITQDVENVTVKSPEGITSICADLCAGRKTEVDTISGSVVRAANKAGIKVPTHEFVVNMIHAMEGRENK
jgi:2-dehydropantoate 2-reductase